MTTPPAGSGGSSRLRESLELVAAVVLLIVVLVVLVRTVGNPLPARRDIPAVIEDGLTEADPYAALAVAAWLIWAFLAYWVIALLGQWVRRTVRWLRRLPPLPLPGRLQHFAGGLVGAVAVTAAQAPAETALPPVDLSTVDTGGQTPTAGTASDVYRQATASQGLELPDRGWLPDPVAQAVNVAAGVVWWRRRRQYDPTRPAPAADADLSPLPRTAVAVQAAVAGTTTTAGISVAGGLVHELPAGGVGLTGPGAAAAARGLLVALLLSRRHGDGPRVVITLPDLQELLGGPAIGRPEPAGLYVADDLDDACAALDTAVVQRPGRPVTIVAAAPDTAPAMQRLAALLTLGSAQGLSGVVIGPWPPGVTWHIQADGTTDAPPTRLSALTATAAADLFTLAALRAGEYQAGPVATPEPATAARVAVGVGNDPRLRLTLLGPVAVVGDQGAVTIRRTAAVQILVFLALHPAGATTEQLCDAIWPHLRSHTGAGRFYTAMSELRGVLRAATGGRELIVHSGDRYVIDHPAVDVDVDRLLTAGRLAAAGPDQTAREVALRDVIGLYRGELAAGHSWPWLAPLRERVRRSVIHAYAQLAAYHPDQAAGLWHEATRVDPLNDYLYEQAVHALTDAGRHETATALHVAHARHLTATGQAELS